MSETAILYASQAPLPMRPSDVFGIVVRTFGLLILLYGAYCGCYAVYTVLFSIPQTTGRPNAGLILFCAFYVGVGLALLRGGWIVRLAYGADMRGQT